MPFRDSTILKAKDPGDLHVGRAAAVVERFHILIVANIKATTSCGPIGDRRTAVTVDVLTLRVQAWLNLDAVAPACAAGIDLGRTRQYQVFVKL